MAKDSEIKFNIKLNENQVPDLIQWEASDAGEKGVSDAILLQIWDAKDKNTLRIDLWTKHMLVDDMKLFFHQALLSMSDTFARATGEEEMALEMRDFAMHFGEKMELIKKAEEE